MKRMIFIICCLVLMSCFSFFGQPQVNTNITVRYYLGTFKIYEADQDSVQGRYIEIEQGDTIKVFQPMFLINPREEK